MAKKSKKTKKKKAKKQAKKKSKTRQKKSSEPVIVPEKVVAGLMGKGELMATDLLELGAGGSDLKLARTQKECVARGGIVRRPPPGSRLPFVCARPPSTGGMGAFVSAADRCAPGFVKVKTKHPYWGRGKFFMCVRPSTRPRIKPPFPSVPAGLREPVPGRFLFPSNVAGGLGAIRLLPEEMSVPMLLVGDGVGILASTVVPRLIASFVKPKSKEIASTISKLALGGAGAALYFPTKTSFTLGFLLGTVPSAVEELADFIAGKIEAAAEKARAEKAPPIEGQLEPEDVRELTEVEELLRPLAQGPEEELTVEFEPPEGIGQADDYDEEVPEMEPLIPAAF